MTIDEFLAEIKVLRGTLKRERRYSPIRCPAGRYPIEALYFHKSGKNAIWTYAAVGLGLSASDRDTIANAADIETSCLTAGTATIRRRLLRALGLKEAK